MSTYQSPYVYNGPIALPSVIDKEGQLIINWPDDQVNVCLMRKELFYDLIQKSNNSTIKATCEQYGVTPEGFAAILEDLFSGDPTDIISKQYYRELGQE